MPLSTSFPDVSNSEFISYLLMLADDLEDSGLEATADDYREAARRLKEVTNE